MSCSLEMRRGSGGTKRRECSTRSYNHDYQTIEPASYLSCNRNHTCVLRCYADPHVCMLIYCCCVLYTEWMYARMRLDWTGPWVRSCFKRVLSSTISLSHVFHSCQSHCLFLEEEAHSRVCEVRGIRYVASFVSCERGIQTEDTKTVRCNHVMLGYVVANGLGIVVGYEAAVRGLTMTSATRRRDSGSRVA